MVICTGGEWTGNVHHLDSGGYGRCPDGHGLVRRVSPPVSNKLATIEEFFRDFTEEVDVADDIDELIKEYASALLDELEGKNDSST